MFSCRINFTHGFTEYSIHCVLKLEWGYNLAISKPCSFFGSLQRSQVIAITRALTWRRRWRPVASCSACLSWPAHWRRAESGTDVRRPLVSSASARSPRRRWSLTPVVPTRPSLFAVRWSSLTQHSTAFWLPLPKTVVNSDSVTALKSRLKQSSSPGLSLFPRSAARCLAPAPLKLRSYGAIQIRVLLSLLLYF